MLSFILDCSTPNRQAHREVRSRSDREGALGCKDATRDQRSGPQPVGRRTPISAAPARSHSLDRDDNVIDLNQLVHFSEQRCRGKFMEVIGGYGAD